MFPSQAPDARASGTQEIRKHRPCVWPCPLGALVWRQAEDVFSDLFTTHWAWRRNRGGLGWSLGLDGRDTVGGGRWQGLSEL